MGKHLLSLFAILALSLVLFVAPEAQARPAARASSLYPIPTVPAANPAAAAHAGVGAAATYLATLTPAALAHTGGPKLGATTSGSGTFTFVLTAKIHGKTVVIGRGSKTAGGAGAITVKLTLTKAGKVALASAKGKLKITVVATFKPKHGASKTAKSTVTLK